MSKLNNYLMSAKPHLGSREDDDSFPIVPRIECRDGFSLSVQTNQGTYCSPRVNYGPWYAVEVGFPSATPELIMDYAEDAERPTETVYGYVPIELVEQLIDAHGGSDQLEAA